MNGKVADVKDDVPRVFFLVTNVKGKMHLNRRQGNWPSVSAAASCVVLCFIHWSLTRIFVRDFSLNEDFHSFFLTGLFLARPQVKIVRQKKIVEKRITAVPFYQKKKVKQIDLFYRLIEIFGVTSLFFCLMEIAVKRNLQLPLVSSEMTKFCFHRK